MSTSLNIKTKYNEIEKSKAVPYIDPNATNNELLLFAQSLVNLTNQSYQETDRIDRINLDNPKGAHRTGNVAMNSTSEPFTAQNTSLAFSFPLADMTKSFQIFIQGNDFQKIGNTPRVSSEQGIMMSMYWNSNDYTSGGKNRCSVGFLLNELKAQTAQIKIVIPADDDWQELDLNITLTITEG